VILDLPPLAKSAACYNIPFMRLSSFATAFFEEDEEEKGEKKKKKKTE